MKIHNCKDISLRSEKVQHPREKNAISASERLNISASHAYSDHTDDPTIRFWSL